MSLSNCRILVTGANGFIGKNLIVRLNEQFNISVITFVRGDDPTLLPKLVSQVDAVVHLAGENRPNDDVSFSKVNSGLTAYLCKAIENEFRATGRHVALVFTSSIQAELDNPYGRSKLLAEASVQDLAKKTGNPCIVFRLPGVFGKWSKPNYNSVVATFCHNISRNLPIKISAPKSELNLVYVDDVVAAILAALETPKSDYVLLKVEPEYASTLGELVKMIKNFCDSSSSLMTERVGTGFVRAIYATYVSFMPRDKFSYDVPRYMDSRGVFVEMLKTTDSGQFSYFTANPGITRGGHYHHTKTEKFLVIKGQALFRFKHLLTKELIEIRTSEETPIVVNTIPGWTHDITNIGNYEMVAILWANENLDRLNPDTVDSKI